MNTVIPALIGFLGVLIGILLNNYFRRNERITKFSEIVFVNRLKIYEKYYSEVQMFSDIVSELQNDKMEPAAKEKLVFQKGLEVCQFSDENSFYLSDELTVHIGATLVGIGGFFSEVATEDEKADQLKQFRLQVRDGLKMIRNESGIDRITNDLKEMAGVEHRSDIIQYYKSQLRR